MRLEKYSIFGATDKGLVRESNEDSFLINLEEQLFAVADGLGGLPSGELASKLAIETLKSSATKELLDFKTVFKEINQVVNKTGSSINPDFGIGTTLTAIQIQNNQLFGGHVGDSGLFLFTKNQWLKLTKDHTMAEDIKDSAGPFKDQLTIPEYYNHILTQCLGKNDNLQVQTFQHALTPNDRLLLYSDGVTKAFSPEELHVLAFESISAEELVTTIIETANSRGGLDNITAIAIFI
jgi:PPM family protein phosphatase